MKRICVFAGLLLAGSVWGIDVRTKGAAVSDEIKSADSLLTKADSLFRQEQIDSALAAYLEVVGRARTEFNRSVEVEAMAQVARMYLRKNELDSAEVWLGQAADRAVDSDPMGWTRYLGVKGRLEWKKENLTLARTTFLEMYEFCHSSGLWDRAVDAAHMLAIVADSVDEQIAWAERGIEAAEAADEIGWLGPLWNNLAITYYEQKKYDTALSCFLKAREYHWRSSAETAKLYADYHVGMVYRHLGKYEQAGQWLRPVLAWAERLENHSAIGQSCEDLGEIALATGQTAEGLTLLRRAREEYRKAGFDATWPEIWTTINRRLQELGE